MHLALPAKMLRVGSSSHAFAAFTTTAAFACGTVALPRRCGFLQCRLLPPPLPQLPLPPAIAVSVLLSKTAADVTRFIGRALDACPACEPCKGRVDASNRASSLHAPYVLRAQLPSEDRS